MSALVPPWVVWRSWGRPIPLTMLAGCIASGLLLVFTALTGDPSTMSRQVSGGCVVTAMLIGAVGAILGFVWKEHLCRPHSSLAGPYRSWHGTVLLVGLLMALLPSVSGLYLATGRIDMALGYGLGPMLLGLSMPFTLSAWGFLALVLVGAMIAAVVESPMLSHALMPDTPGNGVGVFLMCLALATVGFVAVGRLDEDDGLYHFHPGFPTRASPVMYGHPLSRAFLRLDRLFWRPAPVTAHSRSLVATAWHRLSVVLPGLMPLVLLPTIVVMVGVVTVLAKTDKAEAVVGISVFFISMIPCTAPTQILQPAFVTARPCEALRPMTRSREAASWLLCLGFAQAKMMVVMGLAIAAPVLAFVPTAASDLMVGFILAVLFAPIQAAVSLVGSTVPHVSWRRLPLLGGGMLPPFLTLFAMRGQPLVIPGWTCAVIAVIDVAIVILAWRAFSRAEIE
jgi:hypothetical protein